MKLIPIRHGNADHDAVDEIRKLSELGTEEAKAAGRWLKEQSFHATKIIHSPLTSPPPSGQV